MVKYLTLILLLLAGPAASQSGPGPGPAPSAGATYANPTATSGLTVVNGSATTGMRSDAATPISQAIAPTWTAQHIFSVNSAASASSVLLSGSAYTSGSGSTAWPQLLIQPSGTTSSNWNTGGTLFGTDAVSGYGGYLADFQIAGTSKLNIDSTGKITTGGQIIAYAGQANPQAWMTQSGFQTIALGNYEWSSTASATGSGDTNLSRDAAGVVDVGTGAQGSKAGTLQAAVVKAVTSLDLVGSSTGYTLLESGLSGSSNNTLTLPTTASDTLAGLGTAQTFTAAQVMSAAGAASTPGLFVTGAHYSGGSGTTTFPQLYVRDSTATAGTSWSTSGTGLGVNEHTGIGNLVDFQVDGVSKFKVDTNGTVTTTSAVAATGFFMSVGQLNTNGFESGSTSGFNWSSTTNPALTPDTYLTRKGAANLNLGAADAAAPVAQTLSVQSVVAGTSNTAGTNFTIAGSQGTGTGTGGSIIFQTAPAGTTGTSQNALATALTIDSTQLSTFGGRISSANGVNVGGTYGGQGTWLSTNNVAADVNVLVGTGNNAGTLELGVSSDVLVGRRAAANLNFGAADAASPVAQTLSVQGVVAGTSNTAGALWKFSDSIGTGTGASGGYEFDTHPAGTTGTSQNAAVAAMKIGSNTHVAFVGTTPVVSACGTGSPAVTGSDTAGTITVGTTATACTLTFGVAFAATPVCVVSDQSVFADITNYTVSTTAITFTLTSNTGDLINYICLRGS